jgi:hypothetical protein
MKALFLSTFMFVLFSCKETDKVRVKVYNNDLVTQSVNATVRNLRTNKIAKVGKDSMYVLKAKPGDSLEVSQKGFGSLTIAAPKTDKPFGIAIFSNNP